MATNVEPEEVQAILDAMGPGGAGGQPGRGGVLSRDFRRPLRLGPEELEALRQRFARALPGIEAELFLALRRGCALDLVEIGEVDCEGLLEGMEPPFALARFEVGGQPGWARWECAAAVAAVEVALGADAPEEPQARELSLVERNMLRRLLGGAAGRLAAAAGLEAKNARAAVTTEEAGSWRDGGENPDPQRLHLRLELDGPGGAAAIDFWLPGIQPAALGAKGRSAAPGLPEHLGPVTVELAARLGSSDVPLAQLLALEEGDVIPLAVPLGERLTVLVEESPCASAILGSRGGRLALRIEGPPPDEEEP